MKKLIGIVLVLLLMFIPLTACASNRAGESAAGLEPDDGVRGTDRPPGDIGDSQLNNNQGSWDDNDWGLAGDPEDSSEPNRNQQSGNQGGGNNLASETEDSDSENNASGTVTIAGTTSNFAARIIHTVSAEIETLEFEDTVELVYTILEENRGFIEDSNIVGRTIRDGERLRRARFVLRIPQTNLNSAVGSLDDLGNITNLRRNAENVSAQFTDTESRLNSLRTQEERLLSMLSNATTLSDMLDLESRISNIRFEIERLTSTLTNLENQVGYSTVRLEITEVRELTEVDPEPEPEPEEEEERTYWQQVWDGFSATVNTLAAFFMGLFRVIVAISPVAIIIAVIAIPIIIFLKKKK